MARFGDRWESVNAWATHLVEPMAEPGTVVGDNEVDAHASKKSGARQKQLLVGVGLTH